MTAEKRNKIIYWVATLWLALGMISTGIFQLMNSKEEVEFIIRLGYPEYFIRFLGVAKLLGIIVVLIPGFLVLKEWVYAGMFFMMFGALYSHIAAGSPMGEVFPPILMLVLITTSWYFRPANRKVVYANQ